MASIFKSAVFKIRNDNKTHGLSMILDMTSPNLYHAHARTVYPPASGKYNPTIVQLNNNVRLVCVTVPINGK